MHISQHAHHRMTQRGLSRRLVDFTLRHGRVEGDRHVLDRNESRRLIDELEEELRLARRVHDRGGVAVVDSGDTLITAIVGERSESKAVELPVDCPSYVGK